MEVLMLQVDLEVDARGLNCPLPILRAKKGINTLNTGQVLQIIATDPGSVKDLEAFCKQTGNQMLESSQQNGEYHFKLRKG
jgi:tRNA 2-thiouridine synthesizing protein A